MPWIISFIRLISWVFSQPAVRQNCTDDIDLEDPGDKPKGKYIISALNTQKHTSKFQVLKGNFAGKLKQMKGKNEKVSAKEEPQDEKTETVDQIKKKYGYTLTAEPSAAKLAQNKVRENIRKLQGISLQTTEMQDTAISFSSMAKEILQSAEHDSSKLLIICP